MKIPKFIARGLVSGSLRLRPEVMDVIKKLSDDSTSRAKAAPVEEQAKQSSSEKEAAAPPPCDSQRRSLVVSPLPGRWIRWSCATFAWIAFCLVQSASAAQNLSAFDAANRTMVAGNLAQASQGFESLIARQGYSAPLLFNLANAQLREGKPGRAILNYERARWLAPNDPDIDANLRLARERSQTVLAAPWPLRFASLFTMNGWAGLGAGSLLLVTATLPLALLLPRRRTVLRLARVLAVVTLLASLAAIGARWGELSRAVIVAKAAPARISPVTVGQAIFTLPEGTMVNIEKSNGPFTLVIAQNGQKGWVSRDDIKPVIPRSTLKE
jgi:hypothetical protein